MTPVDQTILHEPSEGRYGNCMQAMVASVLGVPIDAVPHFLHDGTQDGHEFSRRVNDFLRPFNLGYMEVTASARDYLDAVGLRGLVHEASGQSARGVSHACVAVDGAVVHDPHPTKAGLESVEDYGIFVVLDPSKAIGRPTC